MAREIDVIDVVAHDTYPLRRAVLRTGTISTEVEIDGDDDPTTRHLAARVGERIVGVSTWLRRAYPPQSGAIAVQLRAMAVDPAERGRGIGAALVRAGLEAAASAGAELVWARARDTALTFYEDLGFRAEGGGYVDPTTGLPHHDIVVGICPPTH